ncbi:asparaginase [Roseimarinus sediminis]|uniref:asparaginase n=1 Tax=Roseimarinus sediminis TaxID=1610899 RepID=UPI003D1CC0F0
MQPSILIIYTGGTIGMVQRPEDGSLAPVNFDELSKEIPMLNKFGYHISSITFDPVLDSSNVTPDFWMKLAETVEQNYEQYDGFVILHGTDTMAYTASALSFMFENLDKPVILTGAQLPIGTLRTDGKENLLTAVEIAAAKHDGLPNVPEVCIYFNSKLFRGNRTTKIDSLQFKAFDSKNYPPLASAGVEIKYASEFVNRTTNKGIFKVNRNIDPHVVILKIFPGIQESIVEAIIEIEGLRGIVLESFGSGNVPEFAWFSKLIEKAIKKGIIIVNVSQCAGGRVMMGLYQTSVDLQRQGVVSAYDMTTEAAVSKLMFLLGQGLSYAEVKKYLNQNLKGEITI